MMTPGLMIMWTRTRPGNYFWLFASPRGHRFPLSQSKRDVILGFYTLLLST